MPARARRVAVDGATRVARAAGAEVCAAALSKSRWRVSAELPTVFSSDVVTARRDHHCCECDGAISRGARHQRASGLWGDRWERYRTCLACVTLRERVGALFAHLPPDELPAFGELGEWLDERDLTWTSPELAEPPREVA